MKLLFVVLSAVALCSAAEPPTSYLENVQFQVHNYIDDLVRNALEYVRSLLKQHDPYHVPDMPRQVITGDNVNLVIDFSNLLVTNASEFTIDKIDNNLLGMWAKFAVTVPKMNLMGNYQVMGKMDGKAVSGSGPFVFNIIGLATSGYVKVGIANWWLQMTELDIDYNIKGLTFDEHGMVVEGLSPEEARSIFSKSVLDYFKNNEKFVASQVSTYVKGIANDIMRGKNLKQLLQWLSDFIHGRVL